MRLTGLFTALTLAFVTFALPHESRAESSLTRATKIAHTLNDELYDVLNNARTSVSLLPG